MIGWQIFFGLSLCGYVCLSVFVILEFYPWQWLLNYKSKKNGIVNSNGKILSECYFDPVTLFYNLKKNLGYFVNELILWRVNDERHFFN